MRRSIWLLIVILGVFSPLPFCIGDEDQTREEFFFKANQSYKEGRFQEAIDGYLRLVRSGNKNGHIYYNLGNAYFRQNDLGRAILSYERARMIIPRDADLNFNLRNAHDQTKDAVPESPGFFSQTFFWLDTVTLEELLSGFLLLNVLFWGILLLRLFSRTEWTYYLSLVFFIFWLIVGVSFGLKWYQVATDDRTVVLQEEVDILAGPEANDTVLFKLHEGTIVNHERSEDGWSLIRLPDRKRGWVKADYIELINSIVTSQ